MDRDRPRPGSTTRIRTRQVAGQDHEGASQDLQANRTTHRRPARVWCDVNHMNTKVPLFALTAIALLTAGIAPTVTAGPTTCLETTCAVASISYKCTGINCGVDAGGEHSGLGLLIAGILKVKGSAVPVSVGEPLENTCAGAGSCSTAVTAPAVTSGCAFATATTKSGDLWESSDTAYDCDPKTMALLEGVTSSGTF